MFSVNSLLYSSVVNLYKLFVLSAGINSFESCLMLFTPFWSCCWNDNFTFLNSIFRTISCKSFHQLFITLKEHKANFKNNPKSRLFNLAKSEIGIISKHYIEEISNMLEEE